MFKEEYILDLLSGRLTQKGYASIVDSIASMVRRYQWQKNIIVSNNNDSNWCDDDYLELSQQFFEWIISNDKLKYIDKVPYEYLSYYFTQMLVSFVSNRIKEEQQKTGISFQKCKELVNAICKEDYTTTSNLGQDYIIGEYSSNDKWISDLDDTIKYMAHYPITEKTKQFKPIVKLAIEDILMSADGYVLIESLGSAVYSLLDQTSFVNTNTEQEAIVDAQQESKYDCEIKEILQGVSSIEARIYLEYIFQDSGKVSLSELSDKYNMPKSTIHNKIDEFKKKIFTTYMPDNEDDGIAFLKSLANSLDDLSK